MLSETVDFLSPDSIKVFKSWTGELRFLPNIKLRKYTKQGLEAMILGTQDPEDQSDSHQMEEDCTTSEDEDQLGEEMMH